MSPARISLLADSGFGQRRSVVNDPFQVG